MVVIDWERFINPATALLDAPGAFSGPPGPGALCLSVGVFDGVHRGHRRLIEKIRDRAKAQGGMAGVITFRQNPRRVLHPQHFLGDIYSLDQKLGALEELGVDLVALIDFSGNFSKLSGREFAALLGRRQVDYLAVGANFRCGHKLDTDAPAIRDIAARNGTITELVAQVRDGDDPVSSSRIRQAILAGDIAAAAALLGRPYRVGLAGLSPRREGSRLVWDLSGQGRVLPPGGPYAALLSSARAAGHTEVRAFFDAGRIFIDGVENSNTVKALLADRKIESAELLGSQ